MSIENRILKMNLDLQKKVLSEIDMVKRGFSKKNILQLDTILLELRKSEQEKGIKLSYPRVIIDSWDYSDTLGTELIRFAEIYEKI